MAVNKYFGKSHQLFYRVADDSAGKQKANHCLSKYFHREELVKIPAPQQKEGQSIIFLRLPNIDSTRCSQKTLHRKDKRVISAVIFFLTPHPPPPPPPPPPSLKVWIRHCSKCVYGYFEKGCQKKCARDNPER